MGGMEGAGGGWTQVGRVLACALVLATGAGCTGRKEPREPPSERAEAGGQARAKPEIPEAVDPGSVARTELWVGLGGGRAVGVYDAASGRELRQLRAGGVPTVVKVSPDGRWAAVAVASGSVRIYDAAKGEEAASVGVKRPTSLDWAPDSKHLWVLSADGGRGNALVLEAPGFEKVADHAIGRAPRGIVLLSDGSRAYVTDAAAGEVLVLDAEHVSVTDSIPVGGAPAGLALDPAEQQLYVAVPARDEVAVLDLARGTRSDSIGVAARPRHAAADEGQHLLADGGGAGLTVVKLDGRGGARAVNEIRAGGATGGVAFGPGDLAYVAESDGYVLVVDPEKASIVRRLRVAGAPAGLSVRVVKKDGSALGPPSRASG